MPVTVTARHVFRSSADVVFAALSEIERFPEVNDDVLSIEFLTDSRQGPGTRFRETRRMGKQTGVFELEVAEYDRDSRRFRAVCEADDVTWDTRMWVEERDTGCEAVLEMVATAHSWPKWLMIRVMGPLFRRGMRTHLAVLERHCSAIPHVRA